MYLVLTKKAQKIWRSHQCKFHKVLFGYLKSPLIGLRKQLSYVAVSHYKETLYILEYLKPALDVSSKGGTG